MHGGDGEAVTWAPLMAALQDHLHLYGVDRPGFGLSDPSTTARWTCAGTPAGFAPTLPLPLRLIFGLPVLPNLMMRRAATLEGQHKQYEQMFKTDPATIPELYFRARIAGVKRPDVQKTWVTLLRRLASVRGYRPGVYLGDELPRISQPTLVIWGEHDMAPATDIREMAARIPAARLRYRAASATSRSCRRPRRLRTKSWSSSRSRRWRRVDPVKAATS